MKRLLTTLVLAVAIVGTSFAEKWINATELGIHGHTKKTDKSPYYRFDHTPYEGFNKTIVNYSKHSAGLYVVFKTNSSKISAKWANVKKRIGDNMTGISQLGLDLYIKDNGKWRYAAVGRVSILPEKNERTKTLIRNLAEGEKECLL